MVTAQTTPLLASDPTAIPLYDPQAMILMDKSIAQGWIAFLSGGDLSPLNHHLKQHHKLKEGPAVDLGFCAIIEGNVVETCFGISPVLPPQLRVVDNPLSRTIRQVQHVKLLLQEAAESSESMRQLVVATYLRAFEIVTNTCDELDQLNCFTRCFFYRGVVKKAQLELQNNFCKLQEALQSWTQTTTTTTTAAPRSS